MLGHFFLGRSLVLAILLSLSVIAIPARASVVTYTGSGAAAGLSAQADFQLLSPSRLMVVLTNTSVSPPNGSDMVLSSVNFKFGGNVSIIGGTVALKTGSLVVVNSGGIWQPSGFNDDIAERFGYSNSGVGNGNPNAIYSGITRPEVFALRRGHVLTSHSNGGNRVRKFSDNSQGLPGGLDFSLVALGSPGFGNKRFIRDSVILTVDLDKKISDLSFLKNGTYVEFGSDYAYVGGKLEQNQVPEPQSIVIWTAMVIGLLGLTQYRRSHKSNGLPSDTV